MRAKEVVVWWGKETKEKYMKKREHKFVVVIVDGANLDKKNCIDTAIIFRIISDLSILSPYNFTSRSDETKIRHIDFNDSTLGDNSQLCVHRRLRVLLDSNNIQIECSVC